MNNRILVIDDQENILEDFRTILSGSENAWVKDVAQAAKAVGMLGFRIDTDAHETYRITTALQGQEGLDLVRRANHMDEPFAVAFIDIRMPPGWDGMKTAAEIRKIDNDIEIVIVTAYSDRNRKEMVEAIGFPGKLLYLKKPFDVEEIRQLALCLTQKWELNRKEQDYRRRLEKLLGKISSMRIHVGDRRRLMESVLEETLDEIRAERGVLVSVKQGSAFTEARRGPLDEHEILGINRVLWELGFDLDGIKEADDHILMPLRTEGREVIVVPGNRLRKEDRPFVEIFLANASELINNARLQEKELRNEKMASIGLATRTILHDLRNPLMHISASLEFCSMHSELPDDLRKWIGAANDGTRRIKDLVTDISEFTMGDMQIQPAPVSLSTFIHDVIKLWKEQFQKHRIELSMDVCDEALVNIDRARLHRVLDNLIGNAVEAMENSLRRNLAISGCLGERRATITIRDSGPGIPQSIRSRIFDPFQSFGKRGGSGLGLAIAKQLVELHGGLLTFETKEDGTSFIIELPLSDPSDGQVGPR